MSIDERIESYLGNGGLFNPELMEHEKVGRLILDIRDELETLRAQIAASDLLLTAGAAELKQASAAISERDDLRDENAALQQRCDMMEGALRRWDCPVCHGTGDYGDRDRGRYVTCHECLGTGRHHFANAVFAATQAAHAKSTP